MSHLPSRLMRITGLALLVLGILLVLDGLLPTRSDGPNPSWLVATVGVVLCVAGWMLRRAAFRAAMIVAVVIFAVVAFVAFGCATVRRDSEVVLHLLITDEEFYRDRMNFILVGSAASLVDCLLLLRLCRRKPHTDENRAA